MPAPNISSQELIAEHLNYVPISLIDDVINAANTLLYRSVEAFDKFARHQMSSITNNLSSQHIGEGMAPLIEFKTDSDEQQMLEQIQVGVHQLETCLENAVDRNFDAFELYTLRNVFSIPCELQGHLKLSHQKVR